MKTFKITLLLVVVASIATATVGFAQCGTSPNSSCCSKDPAVGASCHDALPVVVPTSPEPDAEQAAPMADHPALMEPVKSAFDSYIKIQSTLAADSLQGVADNATAVAKAVRGDSMKMLSAKVADQADRLGKAKNVEAAREEFKGLSTSLIAYLRDNKVTGSGLSQTYCPMAKAEWLQTDKNVNNPYMGKSMPSCGSIKQTF